MPKWFRRQDAGFGLDRQDFGTITIFESTVPLRGFLRRGKKWNIFQVYLPEFPAGNGTNIIIPMSNFCPASCCLFGGPLYYDSHVDLCYNVPLFLLYIMQIGKVKCAHLQMPQILNWRLASKQWIYFLLRQSATGPGLYWAQLLKSPALERSGRELRTNIGDLVSQILPQFHQASRVAGSLTRRIILAANFIFVGFLSRWEALIIDKGVYGSKLFRRQQSGRWERKWKADN